MGEVPLLLLHPPRLLHLDRGHIRRLMLVRHVPIPVGRVLAGLELRVLLVQRLLTKPQFGVGLTGAHGELICVLLGTSILLQRLTLAGLVADVR